LLTYLCYLGLLSVQLRLPPFGLETSRRKRACHYNRKTEKRGGDEWGKDLRQSTYTVNSVNQYTALNIPGYVDVQGEAAATATVTVNGAKAQRAGAYFRSELLFNASTGAVYSIITNIAVLQNGTNSDIIATNIGRYPLAANPQTLLYDLDGNLTNDGKFIYTWDGENRLTTVEPQPRRGQTIVWAGFGSVIAVVVSLAGPFIDLCTSMLALFEVPRCYELF
jgi:hypothetical protein